MPEPRDPDLGPHPNLNKEPLRTGNPPETQADREDVPFGPPTWAVDRMSAGLLALILVTVLLAVAAVVIGLLPGLMPW